MKNKIKKHTVLIILLVIVLVFPTSLSYQARLNMRVIVTGLAIDKTDDEYMLTAQIVKTSPGNESPGQSAMIDFVTDKAKNLSEAVSKLAYKAGKVSAFSHTNFLVLGNSLLKEDVTKCLDYFIRDKVIKNSALVLFSGGSAEEEIKKTKDTELSVGIGLQKVFLFKENEGDGLMVTLIDFLNQNKMYSCTSCASELSFHTNDEAKQGLAVAVVVLAKVLHRVVQAQLAAEVQVLAAAVVVNLVANQNRLKASNILTQKVLLYVLLKECLSASLKKKKILMGLRLQKTYRKKPMLMFKM